MRYCPCGFTAVLVLVSSAALAGGSADAVRIAKPKMVFVSRDRVAAICGTGHSTDACTQFDDLLLTSVCRTTPLGWSTHSEFSATTRVVLTDAWFLVHEMGHVQDFRMMLGQYLAGVDEVSYSSLGDCAVAAVRVKATFAAKLDEVRRISAFRRDHSPLAGSVRMRQNEPGELEAVVIAAAEPRGALDDRPAKVGGSLAATGDEALQPFLADAVPQ